MAMTIDNPTTRRSFRKPELPEMLRRLISYADVPGEDLEIRRTKHLFIGVLWISLVTSAITCTQFIVRDEPAAALTLGVLLVLTFAVLWLLRLRPAAYPGVMHLVIGYSVGASVVLTLLFGGFLESGGNAMWGFIAVLGAIVIFEDRRAAAWFVAFVAVMLATTITADRLDPVYVLPNAEFQAVFNLIVILGFIFAMLFYYVRQRSTLLRESESLLRNILPDEVADRLKRSPEMIVDDFEDASILFADVAGFTPMSATMTPGELVDLLNEVFSDFDTLVEARGLEKIKTIGDAYMVAAGVPAPRTDHAHAICDLALEMQSHASSRLFGGQHLQFRIGVNSGPVVAGIIGRRKFSYDLWGDAVNTASRMESFGVVGRIQLTDATRALVEDEFVCEPGGTVDVKGKGPMTVWHLVGRR
jgi:adenylate cyclase